MAPPVIVRETRKHGKDRASDYKSTEGTQMSAKDRAMADQRKRHKAAVERAADEARERLRLREMARGELRQ